MNISECKMQLQSKEISCEQLTLRCLLSIKESQLNSVSQIDPTAVKQAKRLDIQGYNNKLPLYGIPILVKDNIDVRGLRTTAGSLALKDNIADKDASIIRNLRNNGAVILGKTNMTEFANYTSDGMMQGYSSYGGQVIHVVNSELSPGGSSSGSAVAVSATLVPAAIGTDTSFSVIGCAQENGICGLKPPMGTLSSKGIIPISKTFDSAAPMAENFSDVLLLYSAMRDVPLHEVKESNIAELKIAVNTVNQEKVSEGQMEVLSKIVHELKTNGAAVSEIYEPFSPYQGLIMKYEFKIQLEKYLKDSNSSMKTLKEIVGYYESNPATMLKYGDTRLRGALYETTGGYLAEPYLEAVKEREKVIEKVRNELEQFDAVIMTGPTNIMHFCGLPSVTVATGEKNVNGVTRCVILYGIDEMRLYGAALAIEKISKNKI